ncbi:MAG TPA: hypothetical protein VJK08_00035 [Patescibacteria group bacterium]|nr:hypothetical protein [Patescibacteria group bacterium]
MKQGKIIMPPDILIESHELAVANILARNGNDVEFITPSQTKGIKKPDIILNKKEWEIKSPRGKSGRTIENNLRSALLQSPNIIIDLSRIKLSDVKCIAETQRQFKLSTKIKNVKIITKKQETIDLSW